MSSKTKKEKIDISDEDLEEHISENTSYSCNFCDETFDWNDDCVDHIKEEHREEFKTDEEYEREEMEQRAVLLGKALEKKNFKERFEIFFGIDKEIESERVSEDSPVVTNHTGVVGFIKKNTPLYLEMIENSYIISKINEITIETDCYRITGKLSPKIKKKAFIFVSLMNKDYINDLIALLEKKTVKDLLTSYTCYTKEKNYPLCIKIQGEGLIALAPMMDGNEYDEFKKNKNRTK